MTIVLKEYLLKCKCFMNNNFDKSNEQKKFSLISHHQLRKDRNDTVLNYDKIYQSGIA